MRIDEYIEKLPTNPELVFKTRVGNYINLPISFDIETTSTYDKDGNKIAFMYAWALNFDNNIIMGRTWGEFAELYVELVKKYNVNSHKRLVIYVHNLSYEFQFISKIFQWSDIFANKERKPIYAVTNEGVEFRCSYVLTNKSLASLGNSLIKYPCKKLIGDLDYNLIRHSFTPLTDKEIGYLENDVTIVVNYIREQLENTNIVKIPYTHTGYVRTRCREYCNKDKNYRKKIKSLTIQPEEYKMLKQAFAGGFTHANHNHVCDSYSNVYSYDLTSAYPSVMLMEKFPMSSGELVKINTIDEFENYMKKYCCLLEVTFKSLLPKFDNEHYLSVSKCTGKSIEEDNGRVVSAEQVTTVITNVDYDIIKQVYSWDSIRIGKFYIYRKDYIPTNLLECVLEFYKKKTTLKNIDEQVNEYMLNKAMLNSIYGMCVTDINRDKFVYTDENGWSTEPVDIENGMEEYNNAKGRFIHYPWGVWITAYNRRNLWSAIIECGKDYIYSDTDSVKFLNLDEHKIFFDKFNAMVERKLRKTSENLNLDWELFNPKDINGKSHLIGIFDYEGMYTKFKTLGAKRYMVEKDGKISITVSGLNKKTVVPYLIEKYGNSCFDFFNDGLVIPEDYTGKLIHTYIDEEISGTIVDYLGNTGEYHEYAYIHLSKSDYNLSLSEKFKLYLNKMVNPNM